MLESSTFESTFFLPYFVLSNFHLCFCNFIETQIMYSISNMQIWPLSRRSGNGHRRLQILNRRLLLSLISVCHICNWSSVNGDLSPVSYTVPNAITIVTTIVNTQLTNGGGTVVLHVSLTTVTGFDSGSVRLFD